MSERVAWVRERVEEALRDCAAEVRQCAWVHLYGVAQGCALLAMRRGVPAEIAVVAGMLHDLATYATGDSANHAARSADMAEALLTGSAMFTPAEVCTVVQAIRHHSDKADMGAPLDEVLKDADVMQHALYDPTMPVAPKEAQRMARLRRELGLNGGDA